MMIVTLTADFHSLAIEAGRARHRRAIARNAKMYGRISTDREGDDIVGCLGEAAVAMVTALPWQPLDPDWHAGDVGKMIEVRARRAPGVGPDLCLQPGDKPNRPFVLAHVHPNYSPTVKLVGWLFAHEGKSRGRWFARGGIYFVEPPYHDMASLLSLVEREKQWRTLKPATAARTCAA